MSSEPRRRVEAVFEAALDRAEAERDAFVRDACGSDAALCSEVMALLAAHARAQGLLDGPDLPSRLGVRPGVGEAIAHPAPTGGAEPAVAEELRFGPYRTLHRLGRGGMGDVYLAVREDAFMRRVALKVLRGGAWSDTSVERFQTERRIMASLDHPNIARLLDGGVTDDGVPYLVMEYVEGLPLVDFCDREKLAVRERLELFRKVCGAVHHAHQNLVIHRDLKPSNILVTTVGEPKLLDFGIAKLQAPALTGTRGPVTRPEARALTPEYASPEQLRGEPLTTASDVYALGVILYELLAGRPPFELKGLSFVEVARAVAEREPPRPSAVMDAAPAAGGSRQPRELDEIVLMALRKEPGRRYASAEQLSSDIARHLASEPVLAVGESRAYRLRTFLRRRRVEAWSAATVVAALALGFGVALSQWRVAEEERDRTTRALERAEASSDFLVGLFDAGEPSEGIADTLSARAILERGLSQVERLDPYPELRARLLTVLGRAQRGVGAYERAEVVLRAAVEDWNLSEPGSLTAEEGREAGATLVELAEVLRVLGRYPEALEAAEQARDVRVATLGPSDQDVATSLIQVGALLVYLGRVEEADSLTRVALGVRRDALGDEDPRVTNAIETLAALARRRGAIDEAEALLRDAVARRRALEGADDPAHATALLRLAALLEEERTDHGEAEALYRRALAILPDSDPSATTALSELGNLLAARGRLDEALELHARAVEGRKVLMGPTHPSVADVLAAEARVALMAGDDASAEAAYREALEIWRTRLGPDHPASAYGLLGLAEVFAYRGEWERAEVMARQGLTVRQDAFPPGNVLTGLAEATLGSVLAGQGDFAEAERLLDSALMSVTEALPPGHRDVRAVHAKLARLYELWGRTEEAARHRRAAGGPPPP
jgi:serine/threonine protein kinase